MNYADYKTQVLEQLTVDAERRGLENFRAQQIRNSVVDLQRFIRGYRKGHTTTYQAADLLAVGCAMRGQMPDGAIPEAFWIVETAVVTSPPCGNTSARRNRLDYFDWNRRFHLTNYPNEPRLYAYSISPYSRDFLIHPLLNDETKLLLVWEGIKRDFADGDVVPWPEDASEASAAYVKWKILLEVDKNPVLAREQFGVYSSKRLSLYRDFQEKLDAEKPDAEVYGAAPEAPGVTAPQSGTIPLAQGDVSKAVTFPNVFASKPVVDCWIIAPDNTAFTIAATPDGSSITTSGFTALLAAAIPAAGYILGWRASLPST